MKYTDDAVLLAKEQSLLQGMTDKLIETGRCYGMEINVRTTGIILHLEHRFP